MHHTSLIQFLDLSSVHFLHVVKNWMVGSLGKRLHFLPLLQYTYIPDQNVSTHAQAFPPTHLAYLNYIVRNQRQYMAKKSSIITLWLARHRLQGICLQRYSDKSTIGIGSTCKQNTIFYILLLQHYVFICVQSCYGLSIRLNKWYIRCFK